MSPFVVFFLILGSGAAVASLALYLIFQDKRESRQVHMQAELQQKMIAQLRTAAELQQFLASDAGRKLFAPEQRARYTWTGVIRSAGSGACLLTAAFVGHYLEPGLPRVVFVVCTALGAGFLSSAAVTAVSLTLLSKQLKTEAQKRDARG